MASTKKRLRFYLEGMAWVGLCALLCGFPCRAQQAPPLDSKPISNLLEASLEKLLINPELPYPESS